MALILTPENQDRDPQRWGRRAWDRLAWRGAEQSNTAVHLYLTKKPDGPRAMVPGVVGPGLCGSAGAASDHRSGSGPFLCAHWNPFQRLRR